MSYPPGPPDPDDPWATPTGPPVGGDPYAQPTYGGAPSPYGQPGYGQPGSPPYPPYGPYGYQQPTNGKATGALWTGVGALVLVFCCGAGILGLVPIVLGVMARGEIRRGGGQQGGDGMAIAGIVMGSIAVVLSIAFIVLIVIGLSTGNSTFDRYDQGGV